MSSVASTKPPMVGKAAGRAASKPKKSDTATAAVKTSTPRGNKAATPKPARGTNRGSEVSLKSDTSDQSGDASRSGGDMSKHSAIELASLLQHLDHLHLSTCCCDQNRCDEKYTVISMSKLELTKPAPEWANTAVVDGEFKDIKLSDFKGKYLVFFFYPADFTFVCPTEIIAFSDRAEEFRAINCEVVACSTDSHFSHLAWINTPRKQGGLGEMKIPLLADKNCEIAKAYGVYKEDAGMAFRGLFIIDGKGNLRQITINDMPVGRSVDETLRLVQAFQFTDVHGEVCPAGWKPGKPTIKPDVKKSKTFFKENN